MNSIILFAGEALKCYRCAPGDDCFEENSDGASVDCVSPDNTACYKGKIGTIFYII